MDYSSDFIVKEYSVDGQVVKAVLQKYVGPGGDVVIPEGVTEISGGYFPPFENCKITSVVIPESVMCIDDHAFQGCIGLKTVYFPACDFNIMSYAFGGCTDIEELVVPIENNKYRAVGTCLLSKDGKKLYCDPSAKGKYCVPDGIETICLGAFEGCRELIEVELPRSVSQIMQSSFEECVNLEKISMVDGIKSIGVCAFKNCTSLQSIMIPDSVTCIGSSAFEGCEMLESVCLPSNIEEIGHCVFQGCKALNELTCNGDRLIVKKLGESPFLETNLNRQWVVIKSCLLELGISQYINSGEPISIPEGVTCIPTGVLDLVCMDSNKFTGVDWFALHDGITDSKTMGGLLKNGLDISFEGYAQTYARYTGKGIDTICVPVLEKEPNRAVAQFCRCILDKKQCKKIGVFVGNHLDSIQSQNAQAVYDMAIALKEKTTIELLKSIVGA